MTVYALVGNPLKQSLSPLLHNTLFKTWNLPATYLTWEVEPEHLDAAVLMFRRNLAGFNVTAPYKQSIIPLLDELHLSAEVYGAVNTVKNETGKLIGYNTDGVGFLKGLEQVDYDLQGKRVLLLGAGGASQTVALELAHQGCSFTIANRDVSRAYMLQRFLESRFAKLDLEITDITRIPRHQYNVVINATPVGMGDLQGQSPLASHYLQGVDLVYDLIYNPLDTKLLQEARLNGCHTINGLRMLVQQGLEAQEIWQGQTVDQELTEKLYQLVEGEISS